ncbi:MAG: flagellar basal body P-ring protein FlgI [Magnetococcales bacterium]|nr:flagellar basal body P-ring protein FlgI [Magnetococcales bacterium]
MLAWLCATPTLFDAHQAEAARLKDVVDIEGVRDNPLTGFGLVVGLNGTGDSSAAFTNQSLKMMLERMGISAEQGVKVKNVASVMVTSTLPPFARQGSRLDVTLSSLGDAKSLQGGTLILTPLKGADGRIYAVAQGPLVVGGFAAGGAGASATKNHPTVGRIAGGATVEKEIDYELNKEQQIQLSLRNPDFTTASRIVQSVNEVFGKPVAVARDSGTIGLTIPPDYQGKVVPFMTRLESVEVDPDQRARIVVNERTGTIVMGDNVRVSTVALAHGNLSIKIKSDPKVSQPNARSQGETVVTPDTALDVKEQDAKVIEMPEGVTLGDLVKGLNGVGVTPRDLIAILQTIKSAGALQAELEIQ